MLLAKEFDHALVGHNYFSYLLGIEFINRGEKVEEGTPVDLKQKHSLPVIEVDYLENGQRQSQSIPKKENWLEKINSLQQSHEILKIKTHEPKLEDIFIKLVKGES